MDATALVIAVIAFMITTYGIIGIGFKFKSIDKTIDKIYSEQRLNATTLSAVTTFELQAESLRQRVENSEKLIERYRNGIDLRINQVEVRLKNIEILLEMANDDSDLSNIIKEMKEDINRLDNERKALKNYLDKEPDFFDIIESSVISSGRWTQFPMYGYNPTPYGYGGQGRGLHHDYSTPITPTPLLDNPQYWEISNQIDLDLVSSNHSDSDSSSSDCGCDGGCDGGD
jgi:hypothetical protein